MFNSSTDSNRFPSNMFSPNDTYDIVKDWYWVFYDKDGNRYVTSDKEKVDGILNKGKRITFTKWEKKNYCLEPTRLRRRPVKIQKVSNIVRIETQEK